MRNGILFSAYKLGVNAACLLRDHSLRRPAVEGWLAAQL